MCVGPLSINGYLVMITGASGAHLVNVNNTIEGSGEISGLGGLDNQSGATIDADQSAQLLIYEQASGTLTNEGVYEATGVGTLNLEASTLIQNQGAPLATSRPSGQKQPSTCPGPRSSAAR